MKRFLLWFKKDISRKKTDLNVGREASAQIKSKKEAAIREVGERYGRAITRLSDT